MPDNPVDETTVAEELRETSGLLPSDTTTEIPIFSSTDTAEVPVAFFESDNFDDDSDDEWHVQTQTKRVGMRIPTAVLIALLIAAGAFWGGAAVQRGRGSGSTGLAGIAARFRGLGAASSTGGGAAGGRLFGGGGAAAGTVGTVTEVNGSTLYITNSSGALVKVVLNSSTKLTRTSTAKSAQLSLGDTVVIQGTTAKNGTVSATSVAATQAGTTAAGGLATALGGAGAG